MPFNHENVKVYQHTLSFNGKAGVWTAQWDSKHAICDQKEERSQILRMLVGLRKSWAQPGRVVREDSAEYSVNDEGSDKARDKDGGGKVHFHHETLDVYQVALEVAVAMCCSAAVSRQPNPVSRRVDQLRTSMILNIAEGNGRFSDADQARVLGTTHESAIKRAARLDLCVTHTLLPRDEVAGWKALLQRVSVMTSSMIAGIQL